MHVRLLGSTGPFKSVKSPLPELAAAVGFCGKQASPLPTSAMAILYV